MATSESPITRTPQATSSMTRRISRFALEQRSRLDDARLDDGIRRLMWAILKDTLRCYQSYADARSIHERRLFRDADRWLRPRDLSWIFSFESICGILQIDSDYLREEVVRWRRRRSPYGCGKSGGEA